MENLQRSEEIAIAAGESFKEREYWLNKLSGDPVRSYFPYDFKGVPTAASHLESLSFELTGENFSRLLKISNQSDSRLHMVLAAVLVVLLHKYTENTDIIMGIPVERQEIEGDFINATLILRNFVTNNMRFKDLLLQVRKTIYEAIENQNYPTEALLYDLNMEFSETQFPLFDVALSLENIQNMKYLQHIHLGMKFSFLREDECIKGLLEYNSLLYREPTAERICKHYQRVMHQVLSDVNVTVDDIDILSGKEKNQLLFEFNSTNQEYPRNQTIHQLFESQVEKTPNNNAVVYEGTRLTYKELNEKAHQLACLLKEKGVKPDTIVAIMVERSLEMIVGLLGILKSGGTYLPLDPEYPEERITYMLGDSNTNMLVSVSPTSTLAEGSDRIWRWEGERILLDPGNVTGFDYSKNLEPAAAFSNSQPAASLAYVIYTSGSTGKPKGVLIRHASIVNTLYWRKSYYKFDGNDSILQVPSFSFDSSVEDIFTPLISGSNLVLIHQQQQLDLGYLGEVMAENQVTHFLMVPNLYKTLLEVQVDPLESLKTVTVAGDNFTAELLDLHFEKLPHVRLFNEYGPTENSVCSTVYELTSGNTRVLIGKPINNISCYILNKQSKLNPIGVPGQLCISGVGLASGYLNAAYLTRERFIPNPLVPGERMYLTGDYARCLTDGNIEFLGRKDLQVKIRGFRIELGEVERQLKTYDGVTDVVITANEDGQGNKYLCAYPVMLPDTQFDVAKMMNFLSTRLPDYMVPAYYFKIDRIPLTPNGKIDRTQLPQPEEHLQTGAEYVAPRNELEEKLAEIWKKELNLEQVGINDNYFTIGGDSIKSIRLISIINRELNKKLKIAELYVNNTIERLAAVISKPETDVSTAEVQYEKAQYEKAIEKVANIKNKFLQGVQNK